MSAIHKFVRSVWECFTYKQKQFSKTAAFMSMGTFIALAQWFFLGFLEGLNLWGFELPAFNYVANAMMLGTLAGLYLANHKIRASASGDSVEFESEQKKEGDD